MGFFGSLKGQLGRDTGRYISNKIFGNKHASKYQRVNSTGKSLMKIPLKDTAFTENSYYSHSIEEVNSQTLQENERERKEQREFALKSEKAMKELISMKIPIQKKPLIDMMFKLSSIISSNPHRNIFEEEHLFSNQYANVALKKYEQCLYMLKTKFPNSTEIQFFENKYRKKKQMAFLQRYWSILLLIAIFVAIGILAYFE